MRLVCAVFIGLLPLAALPAAGEFTPVLFEDRIVLQVAGATPRQVCRAIADRPVGEMISPPSADEGFPIGDPRSGAIYYRTRNAHDGNTSYLMWTVVIEDDDDNGIYRDL